MTLVQVEDRGRRRDWGSKLLGVARM